MSSTPKHIQLYRAFGWKPPDFAHVGLLQDDQQQKLSKRDVQAAGLDVRKFQDQGILPAALLNYAALFGWSHTGDSDVMNLKELIQVVRKHKQCKESSALTFFSSTSSSRKAILWLCLRSSNSYRRNMHRNPLKKEGQCSTPWSKK